MPQLLAVTPSAAILEAKANRPIEQLLAVAPSAESCVPDDAENPRPDVFPDTFAPFALMLHAAIPPTPAVPPALCAEPFSNSMVEPLDTHTPQLPASSACPLVASINEAPFARNPYVPQLFAIPERASKTAA